VLSVAYYDQIANALYDEHNTRLLNKNVFIVINWLMLSASFDPNVITLSIEKIRSLFKQQECTLELSGK
jgi:hypothetical protein